MIQNFEQCLEMLLHHEGGFVNHPADPGGMTNLGVTKKVYEEFLGREVTEEEMRALTQENVAPLYKRNYWDRLKGDDLPAGIDWACFDWGVNSGTGRSAKALQTCIGATADGAIGPNTLKKLGEFDPKEIVLQMFDVRQQFYEGLSTFETFGKGWTRRNSETLDQAIAMIENS